MKNFIWLWAERLGLLGFLCFLAFTMWTYALERGSFEMVRVAYGEELPDSNFDKGKHNFHRCKLEDGSTRVTVHGYPNMNRIQVRGKEVHPNHLIKILYEDFGVRAGEKVHIQCCYPGDKVPSSYMGVDYNFYGKESKVVHFMSDPISKKIYLYYKE